MMNKELLQVEFRYHDVHKGLSSDVAWINKTITIGVYDTLEEAVIEGNKILDILSKKFQVRPTDKFKVKGLFGFPDRLVTNTCYPTKGIEYFAKITKLEYSSLEDMIEETFCAADRYIKYRNER